MWFTFFSDLLRRRKMNTCFIFLAVCIAAFLFSSCEMKRRLYRKGFYTETFANKKHAKTIKTNTDSDSVHFYFSEKKQVVLPHHKDSVRTKVCAVHEPEKKIAAAISAMPEKSVALKGTSKKEQNKGTTIVIKQVERIAVTEEIDFEKERQIFNSSLLSFVFSILALILFLPWGISILLFFAGLMFAIVSIVLGAVSIRQASKLSFKVRGIAFAYMGMAISIVSLLLLALFFFIFSGFF